jgi:4-hydroxy-tetrahydrodipicolinate synthase
VKKVEYPRLMTAMITPFKTGMEIDFDRVIEMSKFLVATGSEGIVVSGTTGESPTLSHEEKLQLFAVVKKAVGGSAQVWAGVGTNSTENSVSLAKEAGELGIDGIMAVAPYYNKPSQQGLYAHFRAIAEAVGLPLMLYNIPSRTGVNILPETMKRLSEIDNIVALKEASGLMDQMSQLRSVTGDDFIIYSGDDSLTLPMMAIGARGVVSVASHLVGKEIRAMIEAYISGQVQKAASIYLQLFPLFKVLFITTNPVPLKEALKLLGKDTGVLRGPLYPAEEKEREEISRVVRLYNLE